MVMIAQYKAAGIEMNSSGLASFSTTKVNPEKINIPMMTTVQGLYIFIFKVTRGIELLSKTKIENYNILSMLIDQKLFNKRSYY